MVYYFRYLQQRMNLSISIHSTQERTKNIPKRLLRPALQTETHNIIQPDQCRQQHLVGWIQVLPYSYRPSDKAIEDKLFRYSTYSYIVLPINRKHTVRLQDRAEKPAAEIWKFSLCLGNSWFPSFTHSLFKLPNYMVISVLANVWMKKKDSMNEGKIHVQMRRRGGSWRGLWRCREKR